MKTQVILALKHVRQEYRQAGQVVTVLWSTDFSIRANEFVAIVGPSGSGKSTFLTIAGGLRHPSSGTVIMNNTDITKLSVKELSRIRLQQVGFILQTSNLVPYLTVEKQLVLIDRAMKRKTQQKRVTHLLDSLSITALRHKYPDELSGGEKQRAALAKALYGTSNLILADEPTASLDTKKAFEVVRLLARETHEQHKATIMVTHDERLLKYCDTVYEMHDGRLKKRP